MERKGKKIATVVCAIFIISVFLLTISGCTNDDKSTTSPTTADTATTENQSTDDSAIKEETEQGFEYDGSAPVTEEMTTLTWLCTNSGSKDYDWESKTWIHELCTRANIELDIELIDKSVYEDVVLPRLAAGNDLPDVMQMPTEDQDMTYIDSGLFYNLTDFYEKYAYNLNVIFAEYTNLKAEMTTPSGQIYYFPSVAPSLKQQQVLLVTKNYIDTLDAEVPESLDEFYDLLIQFRDTDMNNDGDTTDEIPLFIRSGKLNNNSGMWGIDLVSHYTVDENGELFYSFTSDQYKEFLIFFNKLYTEGLMNSDFSSANSDIQKNLYANNRIGIMLQYMGLAVDQSYKFNENWDPDADEFEVIPMKPLSGATPDPYYVGRDNLRAFFGINADSEKALEAFCFMDYVMGADAYYLREFGDECEVDESTGIVYANDVEEWTLNRNTYGFNFKGLPAAEQFILFSRSKEYDKLVPVMAEYTRPLTVNFSFLLENEIDVTNKYITDLKTYAEEMETAFIIGTKSIKDDWDDYVTQCEELHSGDLLEVYSAIYNRQK